MLEPATGEAILLLQVDQDFEIGEIIGGVMDGVSKEGWPLWRKGSRRPGVARLCVCSSRSEYD
ncbi:hypothetical protein ACFLVX_01690 [Chloroflexota bacterium]